MKMLISPKAAGHSRDCSMDPNKENQLEPSCHAQLGTSVAHNFTAAGMNRKKKTERQTQGLVGDTCHVNALGQSLEPRAWDGWRAQGSRPPWLARRRHHASGDPPLLISLKSQNTLPGCSARSSGGGGWRLRRAGAPCRPAPSPAGNFEISLTPGGCYALQHGIHNLPACLPACMHACCPRLCVIACKLARASLATHLPIGLLAVLALLLGLRNTAPVCGDASATCC